MPGRNFAVAVRELQAPGYSLAAASDRGGRHASDPGDIEPGARSGNLDCVVELWDEAKTAPEQVLAMTADASIGYAAYYAAAREYPARYVTLRRGDRILSSWNAPGE